MLPNAAQFNPMMMNNNPYYPFHQKITCTQCKNVEEVFVPPKPAMDALEESFVFLSDLNSGSTALQSHGTKVERVEEINYLIDDIIESGDMDSILRQQSLCGLCMNDLFEEFSRREEFLKQECDTFEKILKKGIPSKDDEKYKADMDKLRKEEYELKENILLYQNDRQFRLGRKAISLQNEIITQQETDKMYWKSYFEYLDNIQNVSEDNRRTLLKIHRKYVPEKLFVLQEGASGIHTINGLRMGTLRTDPVPWDEINAGWGLCALMLNC